MIRRVWNAYTVEFANAIRLRGTYVGPFFVGLTILVLTFQYPLARDPVSDFSFLAMVMPISLDLVGTIAILAYCAVLIGADAGGGAHRFLFVQPIKRVDYLIAKTLMAWTYVLVLAGIATVLSVGISVLFGELTGIYFGDDILFSASEMQAAFVIALGLSLLPLFTTASFAILISSFCGSRSSALVATFMCWVLLDVLKNPLQIADYVFLTYHEYPWTVFADRCDAIATSWLPQSVFLVGTSAAWTGLSFCFAWLLLANKDVSE